MNRTIQCIQFFNVLTILEKQVNRLKSELVKDEGLKGSDVSLLLALYTDPQGLRHDEFSRLIRADKAQISRSLKSLREHGIVEQDSAGVYKARYRLTEKGRKLADDLVSEASRILDDAHMMLEEQEWHRFYVLCSSISELFEKELQRRSRESEKKRTEHV